MEADELPPHITLGRYLQMLEIARAKHALGPGKDHMHAGRSLRDPLLLRLIWNTGGGVSDIADVRAGNFDFRIMLLNLRVKKTPKVDPMPLEEGTLLDVGNFSNRPYGEPICWINWWQIRHVAREYGRDIRIDVHSHMFRHGHVIHLLNQNVPIPVILARLGN